MGGFMKKTGNQGSPQQKYFAIFLSAIILAFSIVIAYFAFFSPSAKERQELKTLWKGSETGTILPASQFTGRAAEAYAVAAKDPELLDYMFCYCYCEQNYGHKSLRTCFTSEHAANCGICIDEAIMAYELRQKKMSIKEIRATIDKQFGGKVQK